MPYALVPRDYILKKVSKQQEAAVNDYRKHEDFKTFLGSPQSGTAVAGTAVSIALLVFIIPIIINFLKALGEDDEFKGQTVGQIAVQLQKDPSGINVARLTTAAFAGIPETLIGVVIPKPIQEEIERQTGLDIGGLFGQLRGGL
jgi:hypothetical protein